MQHILTSHNYLTKAISSLIDLINDSLSGLWDSIIQARQIEANRRIAPMLKCEYPHMTINQIWDMLNRNTMGLDHLPQADL
jgi:hypothetical protein